MQGNTGFPCYNNRNPNDFDGKKGEGGWKMAAKRCIIPLHRTPAGRWVLAAALTALAAALICLAVFRPAREPTVSPRLQAAAQGLTEYSVALRLLPESGEIAISETIRYRNDTGDTLDHLLLRTWLNAYQTEESSPAATDELYDACYPEGFSPGGLTLYDVLWNGEAAEHGYTDAEKTALRVQIPSLAPEETGELFLRCIAAIPVCAHRTGRMGDAYNLGNVLPLLSHYQAGAWRADAYSPIGDPFLSDCANFSVALYGAAEYNVAASAVMRRGEDGVWRGELLSARDFALCLGKDWKIAQGWAGDTYVLSCAATEAGAGRALDAAKQAAAVYAGLYGEVPYPALTVCQAEFPFTGMEYPGLCMIGSGNYLESRADSLELTVAHETAHQWFYALVGSDQARDPWQDEAICEYAMLRYVRARYGQGSFESLKSLRVDAAMQEQHLGALTPGSPIDYFASLGDYATVVYHRGAALLLALDGMLPGGVDDFLRAYAEAFAYRFVTRAQFEEFLCGYAGMDLRPLLLDYLDTAL